MSAVEDLVLSTVEPTARAVEAPARSTGAVKVNEQRHLAPSYRLLRAH